LEETMAESNCSCERDCACGDEDLSPDEAEDKLIERERGRLMKASSVLGCLVIGLSEGDGVELDEGEPYYPDIAEIARGLVEEALRNLDSVERIKVRRNAGEKETPERGDEPDGEEQASDDNG
jgi:hypothetical protein